MISTIHNSSTLVDQIPEQKQELFLLLLPLLLLQALGWIAATLELLDAKESEGLRHLVKKFFLGFVFVILATIDMTSIQWSLVFSFLLAKLTLYLVIFLLSLALTRSLSQASLLGLLASQPSSWGLGLPLLLSSPSPSLFCSLLGTSVLLRNISLLILHTDCQSSHEDAGVSYLVLGLRAAKSLLTSPLCATMVLASLTNIVFFCLTCSSLAPHTTHHHYFSPLVSSLCQAFTSLAPFTLGLSLSGHTTNYSGHTGDGSRININSCSNVNNINNSKMSSSRSLTVAVVVLLRNLLCPLVTYLLVRQTSPGPLLALVLLLSMLSPGPEVVHLAVHPGQAEVLQAGVQGAALLAVPVLCLLSYA